jgi:hypothetical protein
MHRSRSAFSDGCSEAFPAQMLRQFSVIYQHLAGVIGRVLENGHQLVIP